MIQIKVHDGQLVVILLDEDRVGSGCDIASASGDDGRLTIPHAYGSE
jgi:hypothetical protein